MSEQNSDINGATRSSNRRAFRQLIGVITDYLEQGYEKIEIWRHLISQGKLSISYPQFTSYVRQYVPRKLEGGKDGKVSGHESKKDGTQESQPRQTVESDRSRKSETKRAFIHNPKAKTLMEFAYGKNEKAEIGKDSLSRAEAKTAPNPDKI